MESKSKTIALFDIIRDVIKNRYMIIKLAKNDFKTKYAGSFLGITWAFVQPIVTILLYWFVFSVGFRSGNVGDYPFVLWLTAGLVPWFFFSDAWNGATNGLLEYSYLVKKVVFNVGILPVIKVSSAFIVNIVFTLFTIILFACSGFYPTVYMIQILYVLICIILFSLALSYFTSAVVVFVRDLSHALSVGLQMLMWVTPIMWNIDMAAKYPWLVVVMKLNPVFYIVQCYRDAMFGEKWFFEHGIWTLYFWGVTILLLFLGTHVFRRLRPHFADIL